MEEFFKKYNIKEGVRRLFVCLSIFYLVVAIICFFPAPGFAFMFIFLSIVNYGFFYLLVWMVKGFKKDV